MEHSPWFGFMLTLRLLVEKLVNFDPHNHITHNHHHPSVDSLLVARNKFPFIINVIVFYLSLFYIRYRVCGLFDMTHTQLTFIHFDIVFSPQFTLQKYTRKMQTNTHKTATDSNVFKQSQNETHKKTFFMFFGGN